MTRTDDGYLPESRWARGPRPILSARYGCRVQRVALVLLVTIMATPAAAQEMIPSGPQPFDRARLSGFWWRGEINGTVSPPAPTGGPGLGDGLDVTEDLGVEGGTNGWLLRADFAPARRHRFQFAFAGLSQSGAGELDLGDAGTFPTAAEISLRDVRGAYQFLVIARPWVQFGAIGGVGYFDSGVDVTVSARPAAGVPSGPALVQIAEQLDGAYPLIGAGVLFEAQDVMAIYTELTGFPSVDAGGQSGWLLNLDIDFIVSPTPWLSIVSGYKRYELSLEEGGGVPVNLVWDGFIVGVQYVF